MSLSMLFRKNGCIPIQYKAVHIDSPFQRLLSSYLNDQPQEYSKIQTDSFIKIYVSEVELSEDDLDLCFEIDHERAKNYLAIEIPTRFYSQKVPIPNNYDIYNSVAVLENGNLQISIPAK